MVLGASLGGLGWLWGASSWTCRGVSWDLSGASWGHPGALFEALEALLVPSWMISIKKEEGGELELMLPLEVPAWMSPPGAFMGCLGGSW